MPSSVLSKITTSRPPSQHNFEKISVPKYYLNYRLFEGEFQASASSTSTERKAAGQAGGALYGLSHLVAAKVPKNNAGGGHNALARRSNVV
jgi:hypothetical protein